MLLQALSFPSISISGWVCLNGFSSYLSTGAALDTTSLLHTLSTFFPSPFKAF